MDWATFWAAFSQIHLVTLVTTLNATKDSCERQGDKMSFLKKIAQNVAQHIFCQNTCIASPVEKSMYPPKIGH
jgi:hypothetical protein